MRHSKTVCSKKAYVSKDRALRALRTIQKTEDDRKKPSRVYECHICHKWHLTSESFDTTKPVNPNRLKFKDEWLKLFNPNT